MKEVLVTVKTVQHDGEQSDTMELTAEGTLAEKGGAYLIKYQDAFLAGPDQPVLTTVRVTAAGAVTVTRTGPYQNRFTLEAGKRCQCLYTTPYGVMTMGFYGELVENNLTESGGTLRLVYAVDVNHKALNRNEMLLTVK